MPGGVHKYCEICDRYANHRYEGLDHILLCQECCDVLRSDSEMSSCSQDSYESDFIDDSSQ